MYYTWVQSAWGKMLLASDGEHLNGAWFEGQPTIKLSAEAIRKDDLPLKPAAKQSLQDNTHANKPAC